MRTEVGQLWTQTHPPTEAGMEGNFGAIVFLTTRLGPVAEKWVPRGYGYGYGFKLGLYRSPTSPPLV